MSELLTGREVPVGDGTEVRRLLPQRQLRTVGAWCFADHYGPDDVTEGPGMAVAPHPHTGLQTVSWLLDGAILHRDSLGSLQRVGARELSLMTAGWGISHSEESPADRPPLLHGVQLWVALPETVREASYEHHTDLPHVERDGLSVTVFLGEHQGLRSPGTTHSPLVGLEARGCGVLSLDPAWEHAVFALEEPAGADDEQLQVGQLLHLEPGRTEVALDGAVVVLGGEPLGEPLVLWWNFVCRSGDEVVQAREDWAGGDRFGEVVGYPGPRLEAPPLGSARLLPRS